MQIVSALLDQLSDFSDAGEVALPADFLQAAEEKIWESQRHEFRPSWNLDEHIRLLEVLQIDSLGETMQLIAFWIYFFMTVLDEMSAA